MRKVVAAALGLYLVLYLVPLAALWNSGGTEETAPPEPSASLRIDRTVTSYADRGRTVRLAMEDGTVEELTMEDYLWRVVAAEMPASFEQEALNAQAVAARTYTAARQSRVTERHPDADVCTQITCCQAYITPEDAAQRWGEQAQAYSEKIRRAVADTDGEVILYDGAPIQAVFFSSAAGETLDAVEVWGSEVPYLSAVSSPEGDEVPNYHTEAAFSAAEFRFILTEAYPEADLSGEPARWLGSVRRNSAGGVASMVIGGTELTGGQLRALFGLRSTYFDLTVRGDELVFSVTGYGHGVGMSQYGANAMAKAGADYREILTWYYTGVTVEQYPDTPGK